MPHAPERDRADGRHRIRRAGGPAAAVTATIAAGSLALAAYTATSTSTAPAEGATASIGQTEPGLSPESVALLSSDTGAKAGKAFAQARELRAQQGADALALSTDLSSSGVSAVRDASKAIAAEKKAEREAAKKAEREAAERAAAEREAAEREAAERAAAERAEQERAAQEAAEREAAERQQAQAASRSAERQSAPAQQSAPAPAPVSSGDARSIARSMLSSFGWGDDQWGCLDSLWMRESGWSHTATNPSSGAYGIPQSLPAGKMASAGADWQTNPATQIKWGLGYISGRYGSPCGAWAHSESVGWY